MFMSWGQLIAGDGSRYENPVVSAFSLSLCLSLPSVLLMEEISFKKKHFRG